MKKHLLLSVALLLSALAVLGQSTITFPASGRLATEAYVDSVFRSLAGPVVVPPTLPRPNVPILQPCAAGPEILAIRNITSTSLQAQFHGQGVYGIDFQILSESGVVRTGSKKPTSNILDLSYDALLPGKYRLRLFGNTCQGRSEKDFSIQGVSVITPPVLPADTKGGQYELFMNLTGYGYNPSEPTGMDKDWTDRIEAYKYSWGWGITGIRLCIRWYQWEPEPGKYTNDGLQKVINYCRERGLKLSVHFWPWRKMGEGFLDDSEIIRGHRGGVFEMENDKIMGSIASEKCNALIYEAVKAMSRQLATYEKSYYLSIGTATAEEFVMPALYLGHPTKAPELSGFEPVFMNKFKQFVESRNRVAFSPPTIYSDSRYAGLIMNNSEIGKEWARFVSIQLKNYFDNFSKAVREGSNDKLIVTYMYPDAASPQNATYLHGNFSFQAQTADGMYGTDGVAQWEFDRKRLCNALNMGLGKISMIEYDPTDLNSPTDAYCKPLDYQRVRNYFKQNYDEGVEVIHFGMAFCVDQIRNMEPQLKFLRENYLGKPYKPVSQPVKVFDMSESFFQGKDIYWDQWDKKSWLRADYTNFFK